MSAACLVVVPLWRGGDPGCEAGLLALAERGYAVRRVEVSSDRGFARWRVAAELLQEGYDEWIWIDPDVVFRAEDVEALRRSQSPVACALAPRPGTREFACRFLPSMKTITLGVGGGLTEVLEARLALAITRRAVWEALFQRYPLAEWEEASRHDREPTQSLAVPSAITRTDPDDTLLCQRMRECGFPIRVDSTIRISVVAEYRFSWEDVGSPQKRFATYHFTPAPVAAPVTTFPVPASAPSLPSQSPRCSPLRGLPRPLPAGFPVMRGYVVTYEANRASLELTLNSVRESDWRDEVEVFSQPIDWPVGFESAARNYCRVLESAAQSGCDYALILEDDVRVGRHLRDNLLAIPLIRRDQCDYLSLYIPDLIQNPWEREEPHLGYRRARSLYSGPNQGWEKFRIWGSQGYVLSRRLILACLERWERLSKGIDARVISVCSELQVPLWYTAPCLIEHAPLQSAHATPTAHAPDYRHDFKLEIQPGFQPPEAIPGWFTESEGRLLYEVTAGREMLELGTCRGRSTVCAAQQARSVISVDIGDQFEAREWVRRYGLADRVEFLRGDAREVCRQWEPQRFDLVFIDTEHDQVSVTRDIESALPLLRPGGLIAFHDYPDPAWPDVRRVVDDYAARRGWTRVAQADYLGVFRTAGE